MCPVHLSLPGPVALARGLRLTGKPGMAWVDRARPALDLLPDGGASLLAAESEEFWTGETEGEWARFTRSWEKLAARRPGSVAVGWVEYGGAFRFGFYPHPAIYEHAADGPGTWRFPGGVPGWWDESVHHASRLGTRGASENSAGLTFHGELTGSEYCRLVRLAQEHIRAGDIYQVNLTHRCFAPWPPGADPFALYLRLREVSPAPEASFLDFPERTVLSASPELFLDLDGRQVRTRPIKGTRPRGTDPASDEAEAHALLASDKERAELLMITDLLRHDLGRICRFGAVRVPELLRLESHAQVFHLVSTVEGTLRPEVSHPEALRSCLPGGSITGAPKRRAREIIAELEAPTPRGLYTGALGVFSAEGWSRFSVVIRTLVVEKGEAHFHVGAGIVADSVPEREYEETLHKAAGILRAAGKFVER